MNVLEQTFKELVSRDLSGLLRLDMYAHANCLEDDGDGGCFVRKGGCELVQRVFSVCPNGVVQSSKLKMALQKSQTEKGRLNYTKKTDGDFLDLTDQYLRMLCANWRWLKSDAVAYGRLFRKASGLEKQTVDEVLSYLNLGEARKLRARTRKQGCPKPETLNLKPPKPI